MGGEKKETVVCETDVCKRKVVFHKPSKSLRNQRDDVTE